MKKVFSRMLCCVLAILSCTNVCAFAQGENKEITSDQLKTFYKDNVEKSFEALKSIGGVFVVVQGDKIIYKEAYGYESTDKENAVQTDESLFRVGSTSKTFTAVAAVQLKERGLLDFNKDISEYLKDTKIKNKFDTPVTMEQLLTHTSGLDTSEILYIVNSLNTENTVKKYMENLKFVVKTKPGTVCSYNNYGIALAGIVIEDVSGVPYGDYLQKNIFEPLRMKHSSIKVDATSPHMTKEYTYNDGQFKPLYQYDLAVPPAGGIVSTGDDMANYMIALLNQGKINGNQILKESSVQELLQTQYRVNDRMDGVCTGFYEETILGNKFIAHNGATLGTATQILLDPDNKIGVFYTTTYGVNQDDPECVRVNMNRINEGFVSTFYPKKTQEISSQTANSEEEISDKKILQGYYSSERGRNENGIEKLLSLLSFSKVEISNNKDLLMDGELYQYKGDNLYENPETHTLLCADVKDDQVYLYQKHSFGSYKKIDNMLPYLLQGVVLLLFVVMWLISLFVLLIKKLRNREVPRYAKRLIRGSIISGVLIILAVFIFFQLMNFYTCFGTTKSILIFAYTLISWIACALLVFDVWTAAKLVRDKNEKKAFRVYGCCIGITSVLVAYIMFFNHMLSFVRGI